ncbi:MAG: histidinol phosphate phosphatase domain-containing protein [Archaeoglobaceae archaeon]|nr:histidinol phosphate phosphatase domain-containing protein [Archaeoglobaceae archaeon]MCX8151981.1 histidinol phosphate phosphatase domain-containing protein [Archaeoglobaceae archaeon]MDW8013370.1 histidinol phosphate phosphatase domain-containing protein [Archaeoglobaceae archaeon]
MDLHSHTILSDGELLPSELLRRVANKKLEFCAITDHVDFSNVSEILSKLLKVKELQEHYEVDFLVGVEITHVPPKLINRIAEIAWKEGAEIVLVHGETIVEPVAEGTNSAALESEINILAHPGLIKLEDAELAASNNIFLEISARKGHCLTNGYVAKIADEVGAKLVFGSDAHAPSDLLNKEDVIKVVKGCGTNQNIISNTRKLFKELRK